MKKKLIYIGLLSLIFTLSALAQVTLTIPNVQAAAVGSSVNVPINVTNFSGVGAITLKITYDATKLTFVDTANAAVGFTVGKGTAGVINLAWYSTNPLNLASGVLTNLKFTYLGGTSTVGFDQTISEIDNSLGAKISGVTYTNGSVSSSSGGGSPTLTIGTVQATATGASVNVPINVTNFSSVGAITLKITYDATKLTFVDTVNSAIGFTVGKGTLGVINLAWYSTTPLNLASGLLTNLKFTYLGGTSTVGFDQTISEIDNASGTKISGVTYTNGTVSAASGGGNPTLTIGTVQASAVGANVNVPINVTNFTSVGAITLKITYDATKLTFVDTVNSAVGFTVGKATAGVLNLAWYSTTPLNLASGLLTNLKFTYLGGTSTVGFDQTISEIDNASGTKISGVTYTNGSVSAAASGGSPTLTIGSVQASAIGASVNVPINVTNISSVGAITLKITYDATKLTFVDTVNSAVGFTVGKATAGVLNLAWYSTTPINIASGLLVNLKFTYLGGTSTVAFDQTISELDNASGTKISGVTYTNGSVYSASGASPTLTIGSVQASAIGASVSVPINVTNISSVGAITLKITYDATKLTFVDTVNSAVGFTVGKATAGVLNLAWYSTTPITIASGLLVNLKFTYLGGTSTVGFDQTISELDNASGTKITGVIYNDGSVTSPSAVSPTLTIGSAQASAIGASVSVPINVTNISSVGAITLNITYDKTVATFLDTANSAVTFTVGRGVLGVINLAWYSTTPLNITSGKLVDLKFTYLGGSSSVAFNQTSCEIDNSSGVKLTGVAYSNGNILLSIPGTTVLRTPASGATNQPIPLTLKWDSVAGAATYRVQVATDSLFTNVVVNDSTVTSNSKLVSGLLNSTKYYWRVNTKNAAGTSGYSVVSSFTTIIASATVPVLRTPANGALNQAVSLTLTWDSIATAATYRVQVATDSLFTAVVVDDSTLTTPKKAVSGLLNSKKYYWRVNAKNVGGTSNYSSAFNFTTIIAIPAVPVLVSPANSSQEQPAKLILSWGAVPGADTYRLQFATDFQFTALLVDDSTLVATSKTVGPLDLGKQYYWRVNAKNIAGTSSFSAAFNFKVTTTDVITPGEMPKEFSLSQNYPNPFNPTTSIQFGLPVRSSVTMEIYNILGVKVRTLIRGEVMNAGFHQMEWNGKDDAGAAVTSGVYMYRINAGTFQVTKKMMMLK